MPKHREKSHIFFSKKVYLEVEDFIYTRYVVQCSLDCLTCFQHHTILNPKIGKMPNIVCNSLTKSSLNIFDACR